MRVLGDALDDPCSISVLKEVKEESGGKGYRVRHRFSNWLGEFDVVGELWTEDQPGPVKAGVLRARFWLENEPPPRPWLVTYIEDVAAGCWSEAVSRVYAGAGNVIVEPEGFSLPFDGHRLSTSFVGFEFDNGMKIVQAVDNPPERLEVAPAGRTYTLHGPHDQTMTFVVSDDLWGAVRCWREVSGLQAAGGVKKLAGRFVFDLWGGRYADSAAALRRAFRYGLTDAVVVWHNWQRHGYDYRLPDIYPPNAQWGSFEEFLELVNTCKQAGVLFAPHDNYIDYYPDAEYFSYAHIAFHADGTPVKGWFNRSTGAQSYRWLAHHVWPSLRRNLHAIRSGFAPTAYFIDVWASAGPYDAWTQDGLLQNRVFTRQVWGQAFAWIRNLLGNDAPQISESGHDQLIGWLDGAQVNHLRVEPKPDEKTGWMAWPIRCKEAERIPWFDAAYHDRFVHHGAGYPGRYDAGLDPKRHGVYSDDYMCTEMLSGHPPMVSHPFGRDVVRKYWLGHDVARALALRPMFEVGFEDGDIHRQRIVWEKGRSEVLANRGRSDWTVSGHVLPPYGFRASVETVEGVVEAAIERVGQTVFEWSRSPGGLYVNARPESNGPAARSGLAGVETSGACRVDVQDGQLRVTPLPESPQFMVWLSWDELPRKLPRPAMAEALDEQGGIIRSIDLAGQGSVIELTCEPGVFAYRLGPAK